MPSGVYAITNTVDGKIYVGSAVNLQQRWWDHRKMLRGNRHRNPYLQAAWDRHGEASFIFSALLECAPEHLVDLEQAELAQRDWNQTYNLNPTAGSRLGTTMSVESREKISHHHRMRSEEARRAHSRIMTGRKYSAERLAQHRQRFRNVETRRKMSEAKRGVLRKAFTEDTRRRMSEAAKRNNTGARLRPDNCKGKPWSAARRAVYELRKAV